MHKLITTLGALSFFASAASATANVSDAQMRNLENRVSALEQRKSASGMINPSGRPEVKDGADVFFTGDVLIWQAHENGLAYVSKAKPAPNESVSSTKEMNFKWSPGFRVGMGWNTPHDGWDLYTRWTCFSTRASGSEDANVSTLQPRFSTAGKEFNPGPTQAKAYWRLHLNTIDLELGREFFVSKWLTLRPFAGLSTSWIKQHMTDKYKGITNQTLGTYTYEVFMRNNFWGIGVRPGLNTQWGLGSGFSIFGNAAFSLLYGFFSMEHDEFSKNTYVVVKKDEGNRHSMRCGKAVAETQLGLRWEHMLASDHCHFAIQAGWENLMYFSQNQFENLYPFLVSNQGDLSIQGYTISLRLDF